MIYSGKPLPKPLQTTTDIERGVLVGEGREAWAREQCVVYRLKLGSWSLELLRHRKKEEHKKEAS